MEKYIIDRGNIKSKIFVKEGKYYNLVNKKHISSYGEFGAANIRDNIMVTFREALNQKNLSDKNNNMLMVGKVQSGKTSNLELFTALSFDNGFNMVVIYGGYDNTLLNQTITRFKKTFDIPAETDYSDCNPIVFSSDDSNQILSVDNEIINDLLESSKPIFIISMKRPVAMKKVNDLFSRINTENLKAFIIDDEGDQASLNTKRNKAIDASATYAEIVKMKKLLNDPLYLSVTATPQALIFQDEYSSLRPDSIRLIEPGEGYCGVDTYHLYDSGIIEIIEDADQEDLTDGVMIESLKNAIQHYVIASSIMFKRKIFTSEMIIHTHRNVNDHDTIYRMIDAYIQTLKDQLDYEDVVSLEVAKLEFLKAYNCFFGLEIQNAYDFDDLWNIICKQVLTRIYLILKNSAGGVTQANESLRKYKIYIGGDLLQRGVTFSNLVTTYFTRWAKKDGGNMDTNLQRARWFGYREKYIDLCKIFTSSTISREFTNLSEIETDLWEQFYSIQLGEMNIDDILIRADDTKQKPTRKNVAKYSTVSFKNKWIKQRMGLFDKKQIDINNGIIDNLLNSYKFQSTSEGRTDGNESATYAIINRADLSTLIEQMQTIFDLEPFEKRPLKDLIDSSDDIPVILMKNNSKDGNGRTRSFYPDNKIFALQQGVDNKDKSKANYLGDSQVIIDKTKINIQIHRIIPQKRNSFGEELVYKDYTQYMFAIYVPKEKKYFVKG